MGGKKRCGNPPSKDRLARDVLQKKGLRSIASECRGEGAGGKGKKKVSPPPCTRKGGEEILARTGGPFWSTLAGRRQCR